MDNKLGQRTNRYALLIGINHFADKDIKPLQGCINDVSLMQDMLSHYFKFEERNITRILDGMATKQQIIASIQELSSKVEEDDDVIIFFTVEEQ